ncbi:MAG: hypothetical protein Alpg2KO_27580 [Alphaproteobacteria bacterium]
MPQNDPWSSLAQKADVEVSFNDHNGTVHIVRWGDIKSKALNNDGSVSLVMDDSVVGRLQGYSGVAQVNRTLLVSAKTLADIYDQAGLPMPKAMNDALARHGVKAANKDDRTTGPSA